MIFYFFIMKTIFITLIILFNYPLIAQIDSHKKEQYLNMIDSKKGTYSIGINANNYRVIDGYSDPKNVKKFHYPLIGVRLSYNPARKFTIGLDYTEQLIWGTNIPKLQRYSFGGAFFRYDIWRRRNAFYLETSYSLSNIAWSNTGWERKNGVSYFGAGFGFKAKLYPNIYFNYSQNFLFPFNNYKILVDRRIGLSYVWHPKIKDTPILISDDKKDRTNKWAVGISAAFLPFDENDFIGGYNDYESVARIGYYQSSFLSFGLYNRFLIGDSRIPNYPTEYFYFTGPFANIKLFGLKRWNIFVEFAYLRSNFTLINGGGTTELPKKGNATYFSTTYGPSFRINDNLSIELGLNMSTALKSNTGAGYTAGGYRLGLEKTFVIKRREVIKTF